MLLALIVILVLSCAVLAACAVIELVKASRDVARAHREVAAIRARLGGL